MAIVMCLTCVFWMMVQQESFLFAVFPINIKSNLLRMISNYQSLSPNEQCSFKVVQG